MQIHNLIPKTKKKKSISVGRGGTRGKTSGRGGKGQTARAGNKKRPELRDFIKRLPKLRGRGVNQNKSPNTKPVVVKISAIESSFDTGSTINPAVLVEKGIVELKNGRIPRIKMLGSDPVTKKFDIEGCLVSQSVKDKIEKAGGTIK